MTIDVQSLILPNPTAREFVLASTPRSPRPSREGMPSAEINDGALLAFDGALSKQMIEDVSNSFLFAQLVADKEFSRHTEGPNWVTRFFATLSKVGWNSSGMHNGSKVHESTVDWSALILSYMPDNVHKLTESSIRACQQLPKTDKAIVTWSGAALENEHGVVIIGGSNLAGDSVVTSVVLLEFTHLREVEGFLKWKCSFDINIVDTTMELNEGVYSSVRQTIISKLGDRPEHLVSNVPLQ